MAKARKSAGQREKSGKKAAADSDVPMQARFDSKCSFCGEAIAEGDEIIWHKQSRRVKCETCACGLDFTADELYDSINYARPIEGR